MDELAAFAPDDLPRARLGRPGVPGLLPELHAGRRAGAARDRLPAGLAARRPPPPGSSQALRAIPWVFAWTQNRCLLPAWYGCGAAFHAYGLEGERLAWLRRLYAEWPFFRALVENLEMTLAKSSFEIAEAYVSLVPAERRTAAASGRRCPPSTSERSSAVLAIVEADELLDRHPVVQRSIRLRNPYVDPMNAIQVELLRAWRGGRRGGAAAAPALDRRDRGSAQEHRLSERRSQKARLRLAGPQLSGLSRVEA